MTRYADNIESGIQAISSANDSRGSVLLTKVRRFTGGGNQTWTGLFPSNTQCVDVKLYIAANGSAATSDTFTISTSAGGTALGTITGVGSAAGLLRGSTTSLGAINLIASACAVIGPATQPNEIQVPFRVIMSSVDTATDYRLVLEYRRALTAP